MDESMKKMAQAVSGRNMHDVTNGARQANQAQPARRVVVDQMR